MKYLLIFIFAFTTQAFAKSINVKSIKVSCSTSSKCENLSDSLKSLKRSYGSIDHLHKVLKLYVSNEGIQDLSYELIEHKEGYTLQISGSQKKIIEEVQSITFKNNKSIELPSILPLREGDFIDFRKVEQTKTIIKEIGKDKGYPDTESEIRVLNKDGGVSIATHVELGKAVKISKMNIISNSKYLKDYLQNILGDFENNVLDLQQIKNEVERARKAFIQFGYYLTDIDLRVKYVGKYKALLFVEVKNPYFYTFFFEEAGGFEESELKIYLSEMMLSYKRELGEDGLVQILTDYAQNLGYGGVEVEVSKKEKVNTKGEEGIYYFINFKVAEKLKLGEVSFKGNGYYSDVELRELFYANGSAQVQSDIHDEKYYKNFLGVLRNKYISNGFVSVFLDDPLIIKDKASGDVNVTYRLREGVQTIVGNINISGTTKGEAESIRSLMVNKFSKPFNPIAFEKDLENIRLALRNDGYYFAKISNINGEGLVKYSPDLSSVNLEIVIDKSSKLYLNKVIIIGNRVTRSRLILRELAIKEGELITSRKIERAQTALLSLGIFNQVQIQPVEGGDSQTDILIFVKERDFGSVEIAPGIRSDLGLKLSTVVNYNNIDGLNKRVTFRASINRRLNLNSIDEARRDEQQNFLEYDTSVDFTENHILRSALDFRSSLGYSRQRFYTYDADIRRFSLGLSSRVNDWFSWQTRYQLEVISGYNTVPSIDENGDLEDPNHAQFKIGSFTPGIVMDFRDRAVATRKGALFGLSVEYANPAFGSEESNPKVDYYKAISRNKFYFPVSDNVVLAMSAALGYQENLARGEDGNGDSIGYIPGIKVFRLSGADIIRGYEDDEMNRIEQTNDDISKYEVNTRAYMASIKIEPRYYYTDNVIMGVFYDAGRIFVDEFKADELKSSVGFTLKYQTPVGTLDLDYGIKLLRNKDSDGTLDSPGRLHVSIGFF